MHPGSNTGQTFLPRLMVDPVLHERLLRKIRTRERFEAELRRDFAGEPDLEASLARLREQGVLDEVRAAEGLVRAKSPASRAELEALLAARGADPGLLGEHDDLAAAREIVRKRAGDPPARVARYLASKGFEADTIESALGGED